MLNLHFFAPRKKKIVSMVHHKKHVNEHYDANCEGSPWESIRLFRVVPHRRSFLWNVLFSLCWSWWYSSWRLKFSWSLFLHSYGFISNSNPFLQKRHNKLTCWHFNDKLIPWGPIDGIKGMSPGSATLFPPHWLPLGSLRSPIFFRPRQFFFHFPLYGSWSQPISYIYL